MAGTNSVEYCSLNDIEDRCPEIKELWYRNERYRQLAAKRTGVSIRTTIGGRQPDLRARYVEKLFDLIRLKKIQPRHLKYLTGISHAAYGMRRKRIGAKDTKVLSLKQTEKMGISTNDYKKLLDNVKSKRSKPIPIKKGVTSKSKADYKDRIWRILNKLCDGWKTEVKFHPKRKWRFDWANEELMVAVEYEGIFSTKSRHTNLTGFTNDCEKYNNAQILGWKVLRYTAANYEQIQKDIEAVLKAKK